MKNYQKRLNELESNSKNGIDHSLLGHVLQQCGVCSISEFMLAFKNYDKLETVNSEWAKMIVLNGCQEIFREYVSQIREEYGESLNIWTK